MTAPESIGSIVIALLTLVAIYFKNKADSSAAKARVADTAAKDAPLAQKQQDIEDKIGVVDAGIEKMKAEHDKLQNQHKTDQERADSWNKNGKS